MRASSGRPVGSRFATLGVLACSLGCAKAEPPEVTQNRTTEAFLRAQVADLKSLITKAESGELDTSSRIAIGIAEDVVSQVLEASLPRTLVVGQRVRVSIVSGVPYFRGNNAGLVFQATAQAVDVESATARLELGGTLEKFRIENGKLLASVELGHFKVLDTSLGALAGDVVERLVKDNLGPLSRAIPAVEIPVHLQQSIRIGGLDHGVVVAKSGALPLAITVAEVIPSGERLWILLDAKAGPWQPSAAEAAKP